ncbi:MAG: winged helix-turn-helix domain-containing protein [Myxococcota bacterium]
MRTSLGSIPLQDGHLDLLAGEVHRGGVATRLSPTEIAVLTVLVTEAPHTVSEAHLLRQAWGYRATNTRTVSVTLSRIRTKIEVDPRSPQRVLTVRGEGYRYVPVPAEDARPPQARLPGLVGRSAEIDAVRAALRDGAQVEIVGPAGIGKRTLARAAVPDARWVDLAGRAGSSTPAEEVTRTDPQPTSASAHACARQGIWCGR